MKNDTYLFNSSDLNDGENVITVVLDPTGLEEDGLLNDLFKVAQFHSCHYSLNLHTAESSWS